MCSLLQDTVLIEQGFHHIMNFSKDSLALKFEKWRLEFGENVNNSKHETTFVKVLLLFGQSAIIYDSIDREFK